MWKDLLDYFQQLGQHPLQRMAFLVGGMVLLWVAEGALPFVSLSYRKNKWRHASVNLSFTLLHLLLHTGFAFFIVLLSDACRNQRFGLVYWWHLPLPLILVVSFGVLDFFGGWLVHRVQHKSALLWRFHVIHHSDPAVDVTTGLRHHPVESLLRGVFFLLGILVSGAPVYAVMIYQTVLVLSTQFTHANLHLPRWLDRLAVYLIVSPSMHKVHHHWKRPYTDSNYGAVLSVWDRMFGTYAHLDAAALHYGLDDPGTGGREEDLLHLLRSPFQPPNRPAV